MNMRRYLARWYRRNRSRYPVHRRDALVDAGLLAYERSLYYLGGRVLFWLKRPRMFVLVVRCRLGFPPPYRVSM